MQAELPRIEKLVNQENINLYARASGDFNPIHVDETFAKKTPLGGTIAHGMLTLAYISEMMTKTFGKNWLTGGKLNIRFRSPARPGDTITVTGRLRKVDKNDGTTIARYDVLCANQNGEPVITGEASVRLTE